MKNENVKVKHEITTGFGLVGHFEFLISYYVYNKVTREVFFYYYNIYKKYLSILSITYGLLTFYKLC